MPWQNDTKFSPKSILYHSTDNVQSSLTVSEFCHIYCPEIISHKFIMRNKCPMMLYASDRNKQNTQL